MAHGEGADPAGNACIGLPPCEDGSCQACQDGMARLQHDVVTLPPDQQALGLVEAILHNARFSEMDTRGQFMMALGLIQGNAERLKVLLEKGGEAGRLKTLEYIRLKIACGASCKEIDDIVRVAIKAAL